MDYGEKLAHPNCRVVFGEKLSNDVVAFTRSFLERAAACSRQFWISRKSFSIITLPLSVPGSELKVQKKKRKSKRNKTN